MRFEVLRWFRGGLDLQQPLKPVEDNLSKLSQPLDFWRLKFGDLKLYPYGC